MLYLDFSPDVKIRMPVVQFHLATIQINISNRELHRNQ